MKHIRLGGVLLLSCLLLTAALPAFSQEQAPEHSLFAQIPPLTTNLDARTWGSDDFIAAVVAGGLTTFKSLPYPLDDFTMPAYITQIVWWGTEMDLTQSPAERYLPVFTISFYEKDETVSPFMPGNLIIEYENAVVDKEDTGLLYMNPATFQFEIPLYRYTYTLPAPLNLPEGLIRIRGAMAGSVNPLAPQDPAQGRAFVHVSSTEGNGVIREFNGEDLPFKVRDNPEKQYDIAVCLLSALEDVPNVVAMEFDDAEQTLAAATFTVGTIGYDYSGTRPAGQIFSQEPAAGEQLYLGQAVNLVLAAQPAVVPNLVGQTQENAGDMLADAGLTLGSVTQVYSDTAPEGSVIQQSIAANSSVEPGTVVNLVISRGKEISVPAAGAAALVALSVALAGIGIARSRRKED